LNLAHLPISEVIYTSQENDFTLLRLKAPQEEPGRSLARYDLHESALPREELYIDPLRVIILQYPEGGRLQLALNEVGQLITLADEQIELRYLADTLSGSSGGPIFSRYGRLLGIHQKAGPQEELRIGVRPTSKYNVGMPIERIITELRAKCPTDLLKELDLADN
jgi:hypothetical protein